MKTMNSGEKRVDGQGVIFATIAATAPNRPVEPIYVKYNTFLAKQDGSVPSGSEVAA